MKRLLVSIFAAVAVLASGIMMAQPSLVLADAKGDICAGIGTADPATNGGCSTSTAPVSNTLRNVINLLSIIAGVVTVIMIIIAGFKYVTSGGDSSKIGSAKTTLTYAIVGIVIVALSQAIVQFVLQKT